MGQAQGQATDLGLSPRRERAFAALVGALVADAAALGFHWLYDVERLAERGGERPEFQTPDPLDFAGVPGYFAHPGKRAGDLSQYGEGLLVLATTLLRAEGRYSVRAHQGVFQEVFGSGGTWSGYVDHPTQATLRNLERGTQAALEAGLAAGSGIPAEARAGAVQRILAKARLASGDELLETLQAAQEAPLSEGARAAAVALDAAWPEASGDQDLQLPALSGLVPLVAIGLDDADIERATRVTHHDDEAVGWALASAAGLRVALSGGTPKEAVAAVAEAARDPLAERLAEGLAITGTAVDVIGILGRNCTLRNAVPGLLNVAAAAPSYEVGVRENVRAGGDSCGRATLLGGILGACYGVGGSRGVPYPWLARLERAAPRIATCHGLASFVPF
ncbi:MAG: ADP-ribosylglycohydrolase family protein [Planctomycetes bacterium]|nr:ADP-ribosylglycohydrolase family protein [Planctomycetota bacterium]